MPRAQGAPKEPPAETPAAVPDRAAPDRAAALLAICRRMGSERDLDALLGLAAREAARLIGADRASIFLLDAERNELWSRVALGSRETVRFDARLGVAGAACARDATIVVRDAQADARFYGGVDERSGYRTQTILATPLRVREGRVIGVFELLNKQEGAFTQEDAEALEALAVHTALAVETAQLVETLRRERADLDARNAELRRLVETSLGTQGILGTSPAIADVVRTVHRLRDSSVNVLLTGESGTGKERVARALHETSRRACAAFVAVNCAALPEALVESELFGIEKGVATGVDARPGRFEQAHGGTLFLDEIGDLGLTAQAKILRVLQEGVIERVGGRRPQPVDVRVVAATNRDLPRALAEGTFREDLYYRLNVVHLHLPPLREIPGDIAPLAAHFLRQFAAAAGRSVPELAPDALELLASYGWPGNVRELRNEMQRATALAHGPVVRASDLSPQVRGAARGTVVSPALASGEAPALGAAVRDLETRMIRAALAEHGGDALAAAKTLGLDKRQLVAKMRRYKLA